MRYCVIAALCLALGATASSFAAGPTSSSQAAVEYILDHVDVDGDGVATPADRFVVEWWVSEGGRLSELVANSGYAAGVLQATTFLEARQVARAMSDVLPISAATSGGTAAAQGASPCDGAVPFYDTLPVPNVTVVPDFDPFANEIQAAVCTSIAMLGSGTTGNGPNGEWVIAFDGMFFDTNFPTFIDPFCFPDGLIFYSLTGPQTTLVDGFCNAPPFLIQPGSDPCGGNCPSDTAQTAAVRGHVQVGLRLTPTGGSPSLHGFTITNGFGLPTGLAGGAVQVTSAAVPPAAQPDEQDMDITVVGNVIINGIGDSGGGVGITDCLNVVVAWNTFETNEADGELGGGLSVTMSRPESGGPGNYCIQDNTFTSNIFDDDFGAAAVQRLGGGIGVSLVGEAGKADERFLGIYRNLVDNNNATEGGGIYAKIEPVDSSAVNMIVEIQDNTIEDNNAWLPNAGTVSTRRAGGGLSFVAEPTGGGLYDVLILKNKLENNSVDAATTAEALGGGLFLDVELTGDMTTQSVVLVENNAVVGNMADAKGGGVACNSPNPTASLSAVSFVHNTVANNELSTAGLAQGGGLHLTAGSAFGGTSNVVYDNVALPSSSPPSASERDWFAELPVGSPATAFSFSQLPAHSGVGFNLFGVSSGFTPPLLVGLNDFRINRNMSPCIDGGNPATVPLALTDFDEEARSLQILGVGGSADWDRGADEFVAHFNRGDANGSVNVEVGDAVAILGYLFSGDPLTNCLDAYDVNDNGGVAIDDPIYLLAWLFSSGPQPPAPFDPLFLVCGRDLTPDSMECNDANSCP
ncbi:MAG: hypothetical protein AAF581_21160 [Planctomycetota bacterium]